MENIQGRRAVAQRRVVEIQETARLKIAAIEQQKESELAPVWVELRAIALEFAQAHPVVWGFRGTNQGYPSEKWVCGPYFLTRHEAESNHRRSSGDGWEVSRYVVCEIHVPLQTIEKQLEIIAEMKSVL